MQHLHNRTNQGDMSIDDWTTCCKEIGANLRGPKRLTITSGALSITWL